MEIMFVCVDILWPFKMYRFLYKHVLFGEFDFTQTEGVDDYNRILKKGQKPYQ